MSEGQRDARDIGLGIGPLPLPPIIPKKGWFRSNFDATSGRSIFKILAVVLSIVLLSISFLAYTTQDKQEHPVFPLKLGSSTDIHTYPNGDTITVPFTSVNDTALTIDFPEGILFPKGDPTNHNNTYVPVQPTPLDPICSTGQFYSDRGKCLWAQDKCPENVSHDVTGFCSVPPQCPVDFKYDVMSRLCVPSTWPVDCTNSTANRLNQEGWGWTVPSGDTITISDRTNPGANIDTKANSIGFVVLWTVPRGSITGYEAGVYYNPVNFYQNVPSDPTKYMFFQVDYGVGAVLGNRQGLVMTFEPGGSGNYAFIKLNDVIIVHGSKYWISGVLEPAPLANPPAYVVQIVQGTHSWIYHKEIDDIQPSTSPVYKFLSFQDEYISTDFASDLSRNEISYPAVISVENGNKISYGSFLTSATPYSSLKRADITGSFKLLSPHLTTSLSSHLIPHNIFTDSRDCQGSGKPSKDIADGPIDMPEDQNTSGTVTTFRPPPIP